jgi:tryptophan halogenase
VPSPPLPPGISRVGVLGGGTAGYFVAIALKRRFPALAVTLIESSALPVIGVGEATTTLMPPFLHHQLGIDVVELYRAVRPTWKLGIKFDWGPPGERCFSYPFGDADPIGAMVHDGDLGAQSLGSLLIATGRTPILREPDGAVRSLLPRTKLAYHLDNPPLVRFLAAHAAALGVEHVDAAVEVVADPGGARVDSLRARDGRRFSYDLYVDASGFPSAILGQALGSPFESYASSLACDTAVVADLPQRGAIAPYTLAQTMDHGWCWSIPVEGADHRGYVFASAFATAEQAAAEMRAKNPGLGDTRLVRFRSGRRRDFFRGNAVAVGNAYGFVEPLESTALHMVIIEIAYLLACLEAPAGALTRDEAGRRVGAHWDYLRWFLALHYRFNRRSDSAFWRAAREGTDISGVAEVVARYQREGPRTDPSADFLAGDPAFGNSGLAILLLGQGVLAPLPAPKLSAEAWRRRVEELERTVARALPQREALDLLRERPELLREFAEGPSSWCRTAEEVVSVSGATGRTALPHVKS